uniref:RNase H domain-containing protein n=1 Tax=Trichuris muris TaxID=70415 RepID=A0A5S6QA39_TRIMR
MEDLTLNGKQFQCKGTSVVRLQPAEGGTPVQAEVLLTCKSSDYTALGGVVVDGQRRVRFGLVKPVACAAVVTELRLDERDFVVSYNHDTRSWTAVWKWSWGEEPGVLYNTAKEYSPTEEARASYEEELQTWIKNRRLVPYDEKKYGAARGLTPVMAVVQRNKSKVRPVMDFRDLNGYIDTFTADTDVCAQKLREWRRQGVNISIIDLKNAYLQICIDESLWPFQTVTFRGRRYCLTRLGFGLNVAPLVMKAVLNLVLSLDESVKKGTAAYIDDILVNEDVIEARRVELHVARYGLTCKPHERVADGARVLGLTVWGEQGRLMWKRDNQVATVPERLTRRSVFSYCGRLVSHFPVCGCLRVASGFVKKRINDASASWGEVVDDRELRALLLEIADVVKKRDPAQGRWDISGDSAKVWVDASALAIGVAVEVNGSIIEDVAWQCPHDTCHINMAEFDDVIKGLNLALTWQMKKIEIITDSATVHRWISDGLLGRTRLKTKAASEMLIR